MRLDIIIKKRLKIRQISTENHEKFMQLGMDAGGTAEIPDSLGGDQNGEGCTYSSLPYPVSSNEIVQRSPRGRYLKFDCLLGSGSFKSVFLGFDTDNGCEVAWNTMSLDRLGGYDRSRVDMEIKLAQTLSHPNILKCVAAWISRETREIIYITERATGGNLRSYIKRIGGPVKLKLIRIWCKQILEGLVYLHTLRPMAVIHRDLKCDNLFVHATTGNVVIGDLGLCTTLGVNPATSLVGTPEFMAPEVYSEQYGTEIDIYAFGMCLLEMISRRRPYEECATPGQIYRKVVSGSRPEDVIRIRNPYLRRIVEDCLQSDPTKRPTACQLLQDPFWTSHTGDNELVDLARETVTKPATLPMRPVADDEVLRDEESVTSLDGSGGRGFDEELLVLQPCERSETVHAAAGREELESIQRKMSISINGGSSIGNSDRHNTAAAPVADVPAEVATSPVGGEIKRRELTKESLENIPEMASVESACVLLGIRTVPAVTLLMETRQGGTRRVSFTYVPGHDTPVSVATELVRSGLTLAESEGGPSFDAIVARVNEALLMRVQSLAASGNRRQVGCSQRQNSTDNHVPSTITL